MLLLFGHLANLISKLRTSLGWIKTYDRYYTDQVRHILDNMVKKLTANPKWKFMYAEVSFFAKWWAEQTVDVREKVMKLLSNGQGRD